MGIAIGNLTFNGTSARSLGVFVSGAGSYSAAALDFTQYQIPGRNGDLIIPNGRYQNIQITYPAFIPGKLPEKVQAVRNWIRSATSYARITDTYDTAHFREGFGVDIQEFAPVRNEGANFQILFECKPQRFLISGQTAQTISTGAVVANPTQFTALPLIQFANPTSSARITVTNSAGTFVLTATRARTGTVLVDCDTQNIYYGATNLNDLFSGSFPVLAPGNNTITFGGMTSVRITPRWWEL